MSTFADFPATTPQLGLPLLFAGQSQKEFFINQSLAALDGLLQRSINGSLSTPPPSAEEGDCFRIAGPATDAWQGREGQLALRLGGDWHYVSPAQGSLIYDRAIGQYLHLGDEWHAASVPQAATGGIIIDAEARALLAQVIDALGKLGLVAAHPA